jgi:hypothetical protein
MLPPFLFELASSVNLIGFVRWSENAIKDEDPVKWPVPGQWRRERWPISSTQTEF